MKHDYRAFLWVIGLFWFSGFLVGSCGLFLFFQSRLNSLSERKLRIRERQRAPSETMTIGRCNSGKPQERWY